jgi:hypothetical protein
MKRVEQSLPSATELIGDVLPTEPLSVSRVEPKDLLAVWYQLVPQIRRGLKRGAGDTLTEKGLFNGVVNGETILWVVHCGEDMVGALFLQIEVRERGKALIVLNVVAGRGQRVGLYGRYGKEIITRLREYGDMVGAYTIESVSRLGAARLMMRHGCKPKAIVMEIRDGRIDQYAAVRDTEDKRCN